MPSRIRRWSSATSTRTIALGVWSAVAMDDGARRRRRPVRARPAPEVLAGLGALARVSRALVGTGSLAELAKRALDEMRAALGLDLAVLYLPLAGRRPGARRGSSPPPPRARTCGRATSCATSPRRGGSRSPAACRSCCASRPAGSARTRSRRPRTTGSCCRSSPGATTWSASSSRPRRAPLALDPVERHRARRCSGSSSTPGSRPRGCASACSARRWSASAAASPPTSTTGWRRTSPSRCASSRCSTSRASTEAEARASRARLRDAVAEAHRIVRSRLEDLHGPVPRGGLRAAVETTVERFERGGLPVRLTVRGAAADVPPGGGRGRLARARRGARQRRPARARAARRPSSCASRASGSSCWSTTTATGFDAAAGRGRGDGHFGLAIMRERARGARRRVRDRPAARRRHARRAADAGGADGRRRGARRRRRHGLVPAPGDPRPGPGRGDPRARVLLRPRRAPQRLAVPPRAARARATPTAPASPRPASTSPRWRRTSGSSSPSRRSRPTRSAGRSAGSRCSSRRWTRGFDAAWFSRFPIGPDEAHVGPALAFDRAWDDAFHGRPAVSLCVYIVDDVDAAARDAPRRHDGAVPRRRRRARRDGAELIRTR